MSEIGKMYEMLRSETKGTDKIPPLWQWTIWSLIKDIDERIQKLEHEEKKREEEKEDDS